MEQFLSKGMFRTFDENVCVRGLPHGGFLVRWTLASGLLVPRALSGPPCASAVGCSHLRFSGNWGKYPGASRVSGISVKKTQIHAEMDRNEQPWWVGVGVSPPVRCPVSAERGQTGPGGGRRVPWGGRPLPWCLALTSFPLS